MSTKVVTKRIISEIIWTEEVPDDFVLPTNEELQEAFIELLKQEVSENAVLKVRISVKDYEVE